MVVVTSTYYNINMKDNYWFFLVAGFNLIETINMAYGMKLESISID